MEVGIGHFVYNFICNRDISVMRGRRCKLTGGKWGDVRNVRRDAMDKAKAMKKAGELTEDTQKTMEEDVQKLTDKYVKNIDAAVEEKQKEIMSV